MGEKKKKVLGGSGRREARGNGEEEKEEERERRWEWEREQQRRESWDKIRSSRYNQWYGRIKGEGIPRYLEKGWGESRWRKIVRFRK